MFKKFITRFKNAREIVRQINRGEWYVGKLLFKNEDKPYRIYSKDGLYSLWIANGSWYVELNREKNHPNAGEPHEDYFGLFWRHYVWHFAIRKFIKRNVSSVSKEILDYKVSDNQNN